MDNKDNNKKPTPPSTSPVITIGKLKIEANKIAYLLIAVIFFSFAGYVGYNALMLTNSKYLFAKTLSETYSSILKEMSKLAPNLTYNSKKDTIEINLENKINFKSDNLKNLISYNNEPLSLLKNNLTIGIDPNNKNILSELSYKENNNTLFDTNLLLEENNIYLKENNLSDSVLTFLPEDTNTNYTNYFNIFFDLLSNNFNNKEYKKYEQIYNEVQKIVLNEINENGSFANGNEKIIINQKEYTLDYASYTINKEEQYLIIKNTIANILENEKITTLLKELNEKNIINELKKINENIDEKNFTNNIAIYLYYNGLTKNFVGFKILENEENILDFYVIDNNIKGHIIKYDINGTIKNKTIEINITNNDENILNIKMTNANKNISITVDDNSKKILIINYILNNNTKSNYQGEISAEIDYANYKATLNILVDVNVNKALNQISTDNAIEYGLTKLKNDYNIIINNSILINYLKTLPKK